MAVRIIVETVSRTAMPYWVWSTPCGLRSRGGSRTTSLCRSLTCTSRFIPLWWATMASRSRSRSGHMRCIRSQNTVSQLTGNTRRGSLPDKEEVNLSWLRQALEWQKDANDPKEFMESLKMDLFSSQVFVFTPQGDVIELPAGCDTAGLCIQDTFGCRM